MTLESAIKKLERNYDLALRNDWVDDKVAWALFNTWREAEYARYMKEERAKNDKT